MDKRKHLLNLIDEMNLPFTTSEAEENISNLSDEEVELLILTYEDIRGFEDAISERLRVVDPSSHEKLKEEYDERVDNAENKYLSDLEKIQEKTDTQLDELEKDAATKIDNSLDESEKDMNVLEEAHDDLYSRIDKTTSL